MFNRNGEASECANTNEASILSATLSESTDMKIIANKELAFHSTVFTPVVHSNQIWLTATELAKALEYKKLMQLLRFTRAIQMSFQLVCQRHSN
ncbi:hypothetical protein B4900_17840 [Yersinia rohdei]|nr:hypothetical protein B4900_17840 [Yersinia rohdei]